jgi:hypothetical protein
MATRASVVSQASVMSQAPPSGAGDMGDMVDRLDALQSTMASLVGRVAVVEVATKIHTDMDAAIDGQFDQLLGLVQGLHAHQGMVFGPPSMGLMVLLLLGSGVPDPHQGPVFHYPYLLHQGTGTAPGNQVSPGGRFKNPAD